VFVFDPERTRRAWVAEVRSREQLSVFVIVGGDVSLPTPDLDLLRAFAVFAAHLNFTRAARALHVSQPALHAQVARLGESLGVTLYRREGRGLTLTNDGRRVAAFARETSERTEALVAELRGREPKSPVVLCAGAGSYLYLLGEAVRAWTLAPKAPLRLLTRDREGTTDAVLQGEAHLGVAPLDAMHDELSVDELAVVPQVLAMPETHALATKRRVTLGDLAGERVVVPGEGRPHRVALDAAMHARGVAWQVAVEANGWELALRFVELGVGVSVVSGFCRLPPGVVARPLPELPAKTYHLFLRRGGGRNQAQTALRRTMLDTCRAWRA
jgi:DNA-binding transcriptional LysR family regulator